MHVLTVNVQKQWGIYVSTFVVTYDFKYQLEPLKPHSTLLHESNDLYINLTKGWGIIDKYVVPFLKINQKCFVTYLLQMAFQLIR